MDWLMDLDIQRFLRTDAKERKVMDDRYLHDYSQAFRGHNDGDIPKVYADAYFALLKKQQKEDPDGVLTLPNSGVVMTKDPKTGHITMQNGYGVHLMVHKDEAGMCAQFLNAPAPTPTPATGSVINPGQNAFDFSPRLKDRHEHNMKELERWALASTKQFPNTK